MFDVISRVGHHKLPLRSRMATTSQMQPHLPMSRRKLRMKPSGARLASTIMGCLIVLVMSPVSAKDFFFRASEIRVVSGDTLRARKLTIKLVGVDAPKLAQRCRTPAGTMVRCGRRSRDELVSMVAGRQLHCVTEGAPSGGRTVAVCYVGEVELHAELAERGFVIEDTSKAGKALATESGRARQIANGLHSPLP